MTNIELMLNSIIAHTYQETVTLKFQDIILGIRIKNLHIQTLVNFILHSFKWELWKQRNVVKFENKRVSSETIVNSLR